MIHAMRARMARKPPMIEPPPKRRQTPPEVTDASASDSLEDSHEESNSAPEITVMVSPRPNITVPPTMTFEMPKFTLNLEEFERLLRQQRQYEFQEWNEQQPTSAEIPPELMENLQETSQKLTIS